MIDGWCISGKVTLRWKSLDLSDDKSTLVQVMAWCRQATSHYLSQCWLRSLSPYGITRPQWVKWQKFVDCISHCDWFNLNNKIGSFYFSHFLQNTRNRHPLYKHGVFVVSSKCDLCSTITITLAPYMVLSLFSTRFAAYTGGIRVSFIQPRLF